MTTSHGPIRSAHRGLSLLELLLALSITAMVAAAISSMLSVVSVGIDSRRDSRTLMLRGQAAQLRLSAYIAPSRCILGASGANIALWLTDSRQSDTVHATEIRWLRYDSVNGELSVYYVAFPAGWTQTMKDLADLEYPRRTDWEAVFTAYSTAGQIDSVVLVDQIDSIDVTLDDVDAQLARIVQYEFTFIDMDADSDITVTSGVRMHHTPAS
ncbi:MAG: prepilin-type N-terminal cleavage/methylation domain-containing protein [Phycisphaerales bacterium]|nr:prepilin-type N-terminal cleavage/methylation domain-containing protein [Phycisphaerales bacterium]